MHPILDALDNTPHGWIKKLLFTFNEGNIGKFEALAPLFPQEAILQENYPFLRQKICLMALIESVFKRNANDRTLTFQTVAEETRLPLEEVEHLMMKALRCVVRPPFPSLPLHLCRVILTCCQYQLEAHPR
jgi:26S proteasome regulatory subunit N9